MGRDAALLLMTDGGFLLNEVRRETVTDLTWERHARSSAERYQRIQLPETIQVCTPRRLVAWSAPSRFSAGVLEEEES